MGSETIVLLSAMPAFLSELLQDIVLPATQQQKAVPSAFHVYIVYRIRQFIFVCVSHLS